MQITSSNIYMVLPLFFEQHGISKTENGILISIGTLAGVFSGLIAGKFSDNFGRKWILVGGTAIYSVVFFLFPFLEQGLQHLLRAPVLRGDRLLRDARPRRGDVRRHLPDEGAWAG